MNDPPLIDTPPVLVSAIEAEVKSSPAPRSRQVRALRDLFRLFTSGRARLGRLSYMDDPPLRGAYLRYHLPLNVARAAWALRQVLMLRPGVRDLTDVVDLGAGPGSASLATLLTLEEGPPRSYLLFDSSSAALKTARRLLERCGAAGPAGPAHPAGPDDRGRRTSGIVTRAGSLPPFPPLPRRALVWLAMVLNELPQASRRDPAALLGKLERALESPSVVIIVEPALRAPGRELLRVHDAAVRSGAWRVLAPCTHQLACPLLRLKDRTWCHFHFRWNAPRIAREIADPLGLEHERPSFSFLALERSGEGACKAIDSSDRPSRGDRLHARAIGDLMKVEGGRKGIYICRDGAREVLVDPPAGPRGRPAARGDIVTFAADGGARIEVPWDPITRSCRREGHS